MKLLSLEPRRMESFAAGQTAVSRPTTFRDETEADSEYLWRSRIENDEIDSIWRVLHRIVQNHPLARTAALTAESSSEIEARSDLVQDLYLHLLRKDRFRHYLGSGMSDQEIEREVCQIELTNMLIGRLRRERPEHYRLARRIGAVLGMDDRFRVIGSQNRYQQAAETLYGLRHWDDEKRIANSSCFNALVADIPVPGRDRRQAGWTGDTDLIISSQELGRLLASILKAIDSPATLRVLRQLALSKLPLLDPVIDSLDAEENDSPSRRLDAIAVSRETPERIALEREREGDTRRLAVRFLDRLSEIVRWNAHRAERFYRVLWHLYFDPNQPTQLEIASFVGLSDSSVSDYRRRLEDELRRLDISPDHAGEFVEALDCELRKRHFAIGHDPGTGHAKSKEMGRQSELPARWSPQMIGPSGHFTLEPFSRDSRRVLLSGQSAID